MTTCAMKYCSNNSMNKKYNKNLSFHQFPRDELYAARWIDKVRQSRNEPGWKPNARTCICSDHFSKNDKYMTKGGLNRIKEGAVPTKYIFSKSGSHETIYQSESDELNIAKVVSTDEANNSPSTSSCKGPDMPAVIRSTDQLSVFKDTEKLKLQQDLHVKSALLTKKNKQIRILNQKIRRLQKRNLSLKNIIKLLKNRRYINNDIHNILSENAFAADLYSNLYKKLKKSKKRPMSKYTTEFRKFCLTLNFYSPKAYIFVRNSFNTCLPHPKTLSNWYSNIEGAPGFTQEAFAILKLKSQNSDKLLICGLVADEMAIRQQVVWDGKQYQGYVDMGTCTTENSNRASEAYIFILVCLNEKWKLPLGYFLVHGLSGDQKANLIKICLTKCHEAGVKVVSLTFDGHATNLSAMELLGCKINDPYHLLTTFNHPSDDHKIAVFLDPAHMLKLIRNHFESKKQFLDSNKNEIDWNFVIELNRLQENMGLHLANKLTRHHIQFRNSIMKVRLATQLMSRSVAVALRCCRDDLKLDSFKNSEGTEKFIQLFNNLFDIFNSRSLKHHGFCHPVIPHNINEITSYLSEVKEYILNLSVKTAHKRTYQESQITRRVTFKSYKPVLKTQAKTGFLGFLVCIESLLHLFKTLVQESNQLKYISTYRLSQDHIEVFFGSIRMHGGYNDNPNARQLKGIYKKLLCHLELKTSQSGNCVPMENIAILTCTSAIKGINSTTSSRHLGIEDIDISSLEDVAGSSLILSTILDDSEPIEFKKLVIGYVAGSVVKILNRKIKCLLCLKNMISDEILDIHKLVGLRDKGGLMYASRSVFKICFIAENMVRSHIHSTNLNLFHIIPLTTKIMTQFIGKHFFPSVNNHLEHHNINLTKLIVETFLKIRLHYLAKTKNLAVTANSKRQLYKKQIQLQGF